MRRPALYALVCLTSGIILGDIFDLPIALLSSLLILTLAFSDSHLPASPKSHKQVP